MAVQFKPGDFNYVYDPAYTAQLSEISNAEGMYNPADLHYRSAKLEDFMQDGKLDLSQGSDIWKALGASQFGTNDPLRAYQAALSDPSSLKYGLHNLAYASGLYGQPAFDRVAGLLQGSQFDPGTVSRAMSDLYTQQQINSQDDFGGLSGLMGSVGNTLGKVTSAVDPYINPLTVGLALLGGVGAGAASAGGTAAEGGLTALDFYGSTAGSPAWYQGAWAAPAGAGGTAGAMMPAAVPEVDPTFGGVLTQTGPGAFGSLASGSPGPTGAPGISSSGSAINAPASEGQALDVYGSTPGNPGWVGGEWPTTGNFELPFGLTWSDLARGIPGALGALASNKQADAYQAQSDKLLSYGEPSRQRFEASFAPGFSMSNDPGFNDALNQASKATLHALSTGGNPAGSPNAWAAALNDLYQKQAYNALQEYRRMNAGAGGMAALTTAAPSAANNAITARGNVFGALGGAASDIFNPPRSLKQLLDEIQKGR
jgi:hypothetical protein